MLNHDQSNPAIDSSKNIVAFSLDYDGMANFLFDEGAQRDYEDFCNPLRSNYSPILDEWIKNYYLAAGEVLDKYLTQESEVADCAELFVGSRRQGRASDRSLGQLNKNGLCFELYADLAEKKGWYFNKLLLADIETDKGVKRVHCLPPGTAMGSFQKNELGRHKYEPNLVCDSLAGPKDDKKTRILLSQLKSLVARYPQDKITLIFVDDCEDILLHLKSALAPYFVLDSSGCLRHKNIELKLMRYDPHCAWEKSCDKTPSKDIPSVALFKKYIEQEFYCIANLTINENTHKAKQHYTAVLHQLANTTFFQKPHSARSAECLSEQQVTVEPSTSY